MFGICIYGITLIPCYYDLLKFINKIGYFVKYKLNIIQYKTIWYRWTCLFDTQSKPY